MPAATVNVATLTEIARMLEVKGTGKLKKADLVDAIVERLMLIKPSGSPKAVEAPKKKELEMPKEPPSKKIGYYVFKTGQARELAGNTAFRQAAHKLGHMKPIYATGLKFEVVGMSEEERDRLIGRCLAAAGGDKDIVVIACKLPSKVNNDILSDMMDLAKLMGVQVTKVEYNKTIAVCSC